MREETKKKEDYDATPEEVRKIIGAAIDEGRIEFPFMEELRQTETDEMLKGTPLGFLRDAARLIKELFSESKGMKQRRQMMPYYMREFVEKMETEYDENKKRGDVLLRDYLGIGRTGGMLSEEEKQRAYENYYQPSQKEITIRDVLGLALMGIPTSAISLGLGKIIPVSKLAPKFVPTGIKRAYHPLYEIIRHKNIQSIKGLSEKLAKETDPEMIDFLKSLIRRYE